MSEKSECRGNTITYINNEWLYEDNMEKVSESDRPCGHCGDSATIEGHDACLGTLIGVMNACCGHGSPNEAYVQFMDGKSIHGESAVVVLNVLREESKNYLNKL